MPKMRVEITIDYDVYERLKFRKTNISGLVNELLRQHLMSGIKPKP